MRSARAVTAPVCGVPLRFRPRELRGAAVLVPVERLLQLLPRRGGLPVQRLDVQRLLLLRVAFVVVELAAAVELVPPRRGELLRHVDALALVRRVPAVHPLARRTFLA